MASRQSVLPSLYAPALAAKVELVISQLPPGDLVMAGMLRQLALPIHPGDEISPRIAVKIVLLSPSLWLDMEMVGWHQRESPDGAELLECAVEFARDYPDVQIDLNNPTVIAVLTRALEWASIPCEFWTLCERSPCRELLRHMEFHGGFLMRAAICIFDVVVGGASVDVLDRFGADEDIDVSPADVRAVIIRGIERYEVPLNDSVLVWLTAKPLPVGFPRDLLQILHRYSTPKLYVWMLRMFDQCGLEALKGLMLCYVQLGYDLCAFFERYPFMLDHRDVRFKEDVFDCMRKIVTYCGLDKK